MSAEEPPDAEAALAETLRFLTVEPEGANGVWTGLPPEWFGPYLFGGFVIAQAIVAATRDAEAGRRVHSLHAYFLRPATASGPLTHTVTTVRAGRTSLTRRVETAQGGKGVLDLTCSLGTDTDGGYVYDLPARSEFGDADRLDARPDSGPGPWVAAFLGPTEPAGDGTRESTHRMWFRIPARLPDDPHVHAALLGFATDWTGIGGRPLHLDGDTTGMISLDHAAWFHRPARPDEWLAYDVQSLVNAGGRGLLRGVMRDRHGRIVVSVAQEMRLTPVPGA